MATKRVKNFFKTKGLNFDVQEFEVSTATVALAAKALGVEPEKIAKTMAFQLKDKPVLVVAKGTARVDNRKFKDAFNQKAKMLSPDALFEATGYQAGGVCPFDLPQITIYLDATLNEFDYVYPAAGSANSAVKITPGELAKITGGLWVDVCGQETRG